MHQSFHIFRKAATAISTTGIKEFLPDTHISPNTFAHMIYVSPYPLAQIGNIVHKADTSGQHSIGSILSHFGRRNIHKDYTEILEQERLIKLGHHLFGFLALNANHHPIRTHKVFDSGPLFQEFGVTGYIEGNICPTLVQLLLNDSLHLLSSTHRYSRFGDQNGIFIDVLSKLTGYGKHILQIGATIFVRRSSYCGKDDFHIIQNFDQICCKVKTPIANVAFY